MSWIFPTGVEESDPTGVDERVDECGLTGLGVNGPTGVDVSGWTGVDVSGPTGVDVSCWTGVAESGPT